MFDHKFKDNDPVANSFLHRSGIKKEDGKFYKKKSEDLEPYVDSVKLIQRLNRESPKKGRLMVHQARIPRIIYDHIVEALYVKGVIEHETVSSEEFNNFIMMFVEREYPAFLVGK